MDTKCAASQGSRDLPQAALRAPGSCGRETRLMQPFRISVSVCLLKSIAEFGRSAAMRSVLNSISKLLISFLSDKTSLPPCVYRGVSPFPLSVQNCKSIKKNERPEQITDQKWKTSKYTSVPGRVLFVTAQLLASILGLLSFPFERFRSVVDLRL